MAFVTRNRTGRWEVRESQATPRGPRSRTLTVFESLSHSHIALAASKSSGELDVDELIAAARRAGAPVSLGPADQAATDLLRALGDGEQLHAGLARLLRDALRAQQKPSTEEALGHVGKSAQQRGDELIDLLLLSDAVPGAGERTKLEFPGIPGSRR